MTSTPVPGVPTGGAPIFDPTRPARRADRDRPLGLEGAARELPEQPVLRRQLQRRRRRGGAGRDPLARRRLAQRGEARAEDRLQQVRALAGVLRLQDPRDRQPDPGREHAARAARVPGLRGDGHRLAAQRARPAHASTASTGGCSPSSSPSASRSSRAGSARRAARSSTTSGAFHYDFDWRGDDPDEYVPRAVPARDERGPPRRRGRPRGLRPGHQRDAARGLRRGDRAAHRRRPLPDPRRGRERDGGGRRHRRRPGPQQLLPLRVRPEEPLRVHPLGQGQHLHERQLAALPQPRQERAHRAPHGRPGQAPGLRRRRGARDVRVRQPALAHAAARDGVPADPRGGARGRAQALLERRVRGGGRTACAA